MSYQARYDKGNWKAICESCGRIVKASDLQRRWDGYMVDERCFETRQPQDFVRGVADYQAPPFTRPEQSDVYIPVTIIYDNYGQLPLQLITSTNNSSITILIVPSPLKSKQTLNGTNLLLNNTTLG